VTATQSAITWFRVRMNDDRGANLVEYAILVGFIALIAIGAVTALGGTTSSQYSDIASRFP